MEDCDQSKVFVGGISWETTEDVLRDHFGSYGTVVGSVIAKDRATGSPRGFAFVSFSDPSALDRVLLDTHTILGRTVEVKKAVPRNEQSQNPQETNRGPNRSSNRTNDNIKTKKIFVGGLSANLTEEDFKVYFEKFGRITDVVVMHDNVTHRPRGFGFITFDREDSVDQVMHKSFHELGGKLVEVKRAVPKEAAAAAGGNGFSGGSSFGRGYPAYPPRYEVVPSYGPFPAYGVGSYPYGGGGGVYGGGFPIGGYGFGPWGGPAMVPVPYGGPAAVYPAYLNGAHGLVGVGVGVGGNSASWRVDSAAGSSGVVDNDSLGSLGAEEKTKAT